MDRREFVTAAGALGAVALGAAGLRRLGSIGMLDKIGVQLYTVRSEMTKSVERTLARVAMIGYREVEFAGYFGRTPEQLRATLAANNLSAPATHVEGVDVEARLDQALDAAARTGIGTLVTAWIPAERRRTLDDYKRWAEVFNKAGDRARASGLAFAYHNHSYEFDAIDGKLPFDLLLAETQPDLVAFELDLYWVTAGGGDPIAYFTRHPGRFRLVHVKDRDALGKMVDVGAGTIDFAAIFRKAGNDIQHYFVEHDEPADPFASIQASYDYLRTLSF